MPFGSQVGHFVIHEIRHGAIVYRDGDNLQEMAIEPSLVQAPAPAPARSVRRSPTMKGDTPSAERTVPLNPSGRNLCYQAPEPDCHHADET
jgi:hypothetical protein